MPPGPFAPHAFHGRGVAAAIGASLVLAGLVAAAPYAPLRATAELPVPPVLVWFPIMIAPLLWHHWLRW